MLAQEIVDNNIKNGLYKKSLGGSVDWIKINRLTINGNSAIANVDVSKYIVLKVIKDGKSYSGKVQGTSNYDFYFKQVNGDWKISLISGGGPSDNTKLTLKPIVQ